MRNLRKGKGCVIYPDLSYKINGILFEARNKVGQFGTEKQYCDKIEQLLGERKLFYEREKCIIISTNDKKRIRHKIDLWLKRKLLWKLKPKI